ncbi:hypothetical protein MHB71_12190 [Paenibacillus sp. FSL H7-0940]|uniref:hypothetical protein n=1 Tax=Paenibacillus sp. FSL H7-0940 TaxID=2921443 RepID=UPI0030EF14D4
MNRNMNKDQLTMTVINLFDDEVMSWVVTLIDKPRRRIKLVRGDEDLRLKR